MQSWSKPASGVSGQYSENAVAATADARYNYDGSRREALEVIVSAARLPKSQSQSVQLTKYSPGPSTAASQMSVRSATMFLLSRTEDSNIFLDKWGYSKLGSSTTI
ncbi:hypothetical protein AnigIFM60653_003444 [Aspergillus niger]|nr:hypothetical protein AnigIFM60653_003444 [Aspergillus niger]